MLDLHFAKLFFPLASCILFCFVSWVISEERSRVPYFKVIRCFLLLIVLAVCFIKIPSIVSALGVVNDGLQAVGKATTKAVALCFGGLASPPKESGLGFILAIQGFPVIIVISAISYLLMYLGVLPCVIRVLSSFFHHTLGIGGTLGMAAATNIFTGISETPLVMKAYLKKFSRNELFSLMVCGTAGTAGSVFIVYSIMLGSLVPNAVGNIITAAVLNIPCALALALIMVPPGEHEHLTEAKDVEFKNATSVLDAISAGIVDGAKVVAMIIIMIIGFVALIDIINMMLCCIPDSVSGALHIAKGEHLTLEKLLGWLVSPITYVLGVPWDEAQQAGGLIGTKVITNELVAFTKFAEVGMQMSEHSRLIVMYALCGFANFGSIGILIGIYEVLAPEKRGDVIKLGVRAVLAGTFSNCLCGSVVAALSSL